MYMFYSDNFTDSDYSRSPQSVRFNAGTTEVTITIRTYEDNVLEPVEELFNIIATYPFQPNNTNDCDVTTVTIMDDDGTVVARYPILHKNLCNKRIVIFIVCLYIRSLAIQYVWHTYNAQTMEYKPHLELLYESSG